MTGTFVGTVSGTDTFVAVVASDTAEAPGSPPVPGRRARLPGAATRANRARLRAQGGKSTAVVRLTERLAQGTVTLPGEHRRHRFAARAATGLAGLYDVHVRSRRQGDGDRPKAEKPRACKPASTASQTSPGRRPRRLPLDRPKPTARPTAQGRASKSGSGSSGFIDPVVDN